jgi:hypothetical protein
MSSIPVPVPGRLCLDLDPLLHVAIQKCRFFGVHPLPFVYLALNCIWEAYAILGYIGPSHIWIIRQESLVSKEVKKFRAGEAARANDCIREVGCGNDSIFNLPTSGILVGLEATKKVPSIDWSEHRDQSQLIPLVRRVTGLHIADWSTC